MKDEIRKKELDLIRQWREKPDENIALYFFNKYKDDILSINYAKIKLKFSSLPLDKEDFFYNVWKSIITCLKEYDLKSNLTFKNFCIKKTYLLSIKEALKFLKNTHIVLNNSYSYERLLDFNKNYDFGPNGKSDINNNFYNQTKKFIDYVVGFNKKFRTSYVKRVIYLRSMGYTTEEIAKKLKLPYKDIRYVLNYICKIAKKLYD